ncbi:MAG: DMT family transporter [Sphingomonadales bacterium]|nr:DMT family transporter [Sphingomonadales bacterium]MDE2569955.1 DMT family transporter [Sphingomonadales bacterium]
MRGNDRAGLLFGLAGFATLSIGDAVVKSMAGTWPGTAIASLRYVFGAIGLATILLAREGRSGFAFPHLRFQLLRGFAVSMSAIAFFSALFLIPLAEATSIGFTAPMITALLAPLVLGEPMRRETWIASIIAFFGVLIVLRPNFAAIGWPALLPLLSATGMALMMIGNRKVAGHASALAMQVSIAVLAVPFLLTAMAIGHLSGLPALHVGWPQWSVVARCAFIAVSASVAHGLIYMATTRAGAATIAPTTYVQLLVATLLGWAVFGEAPDAMALLGAAIIIGAGLYLWRSGPVRQPAIGE